MLKKYPPHVHYDRQYQHSGEVIYIFSHPVAGTLGQLRLFVKDGMNHVQWEWEANTLKGHPAQVQLEMFISALVKDLKKKIKRLHRKNRITCIH